MGINNSAGGTATTISVGTDSAFGTGKVTNILLPGNSSPLLQATGSDRTLANAFDVNGGLTFNGSQSITFTGPFNIINTLTGGARTLNNTITTVGKSITYGSSGSPSTITIGNPAANGGDDVGKNVIFNGSSNTLTVINDVLQDPAAGGGTASGTVTYTGNSTGIIQLNSLNKYTGPTMLNGGSTLQFNHDYNAGDPSGPFGLGTLTPNSGTNNILQPIGADRTIANPMLLHSGFTVSNASGADATRSLTFTGSITSDNTGRTIQNNFPAAGGTLTLGSAGSPSTITAPTVTALTMTIQGAGKTVINDTIQEVPASGNATNLSITATGTVNFNGVISTAGTVTISGAYTPSTQVGAVITMNAQNTYSGQTNLSGAQTLIPIVISSNDLPGAGFTSGPFGTGTLNFNNGSNQHLRPTGNQIISNAITMTTGFAMDTAPGDTTSSLEYAGPITEAASGKFISCGFNNNNGGGQAIGKMILGDPSAPSTITIASGGILNITALWGQIDVNDVIQDGATAGSVVFNNQGSATGGNNDIMPIKLNSQNTYTGGTTIGGSADYPVGPMLLAVDSTGDPDALSSGPFGTGTVTMNNPNTGVHAAQPNLVPYGGDRTIANAIVLTSGFIASNSADSGEGTRNLNLTGSISLGSAGRSIVNNMAGTLTLGKNTTVDSVNPITLAGAGDQPLTFTGTSTLATVVNDQIVNGGGGIIPGAVSVAGGVVRLNNANTYGTSGTTPSTLPNTKVTGGILLVNNTGGSGTGIGNVSVTGGILGGTGTISQSVSLTGGAIAPGDNGAGTLNVGTNVTYSGTGALNIELGGGTTAGTDYDQLLVGGQADLTAGGTLNVSLINAFNPSVDTDFTVLTATGGLILSGGTTGFTSFTYPAVTHWSTTYTANSVIVHYSAAGGASLGGTNVPEPGTFALLLAAVGSALFCPRRACRRPKI